MRQTTKLALLSLLGALAVLAFNLSVPSLLNFYFWSNRLARWHSYIEYIVSLHTNDGTFARRPVVTFLIHSFIHVSGLDSWWSFLVIQGLLLGLSAFAVGKLASRLSGPSYASRAILAFFLSFSVLFAFVTPNDCFDEYAQYFFLFLSLHFLAGDRQGLFALAYGLALLARETSILLLPSLVYLDHSQPGNRWLKGLKYSVPVVGYALYFRHFAPSDDPRRFWHLWQDNFPTLERSFETLVSWALAVSLPMILLVSAPRPEESERKWRIAFWIALPINTLAVLGFAQARESRLFALPLVFLWPFAGRWLKEMQDRLRTGASARWELALGLIGTAILMEYYHPAYRHVLGYRIYAAMIPIFFAIALSARDRSFRE